MRAPSEGLPGCARMLGGTARCACCPRHACVRAHLVQAELRCAALLQVGVRILGGLMALGYEIGTIMRRTSQVLSVSGLADELQVKLDEVEGLGSFIQVRRGAARGRCRGSGAGTGAGAKDTKGRTGPCRPTCKRSPVCTACCACPPVWPAI